MRYDPFPVDTDVFPVEPMPENSIPRVNGGVTSWCVLEKLAKTAASLRILILQVIMAKICLVDVVKPRWTTNIVATEFQNPDAHVSLHPSSADLSCHLLFYLDSSRARRVEVVKLIDILAKGANLALLNRIPAPLQERDAGRVCRYFQHAWRYIVIKRRFYSRTPSAKWPGISLSPAFWLSEP